MPGKLVNVVVQSKIDHQPGVGGTARRLDTAYFIRLDYSYEVDGKPYFSSRYSLGNGNVVDSEYYDTQEEAEAQARKEYGEVQELTVFYDPDDPAEAVIKPGWNWGTFAPLLIGLFLIASGWLMRAIISRAEPNAANSAQA
ncbi:DUF3592 domain-containing protein [Oceaniferula flava]|uniref:DUF3592 domain-containing protein n=1 Tax=Oceaniferula flava TaxID=2800421 RepID=UPI003CCCFA1D